MFTLSLFYNTVHFESACDLDLKMSSSFSRLSNAQEICLGKQANAQFLFLSCSLQKILRHYHYVLWSCDMNITTSRPYMQGNNALARGIIIIGRFGWIWLATHGPLLTLACGLDKLVLLCHTDHDLF